MAKSPKLITGDLPRWLAFHLFDQNSGLYTVYEVAREQAFQYLTSFATEGVLNDALSIVKANEHYKMNLEFIVASPRIPFLKIFSTSSTLSWQL